MWWSLSHKATGRVYVPAKPTSDCEPVSELHWDWRERQVSWEADSNGTCIAIFPPFFHFLSSLNAWCALSSTRRMCFLSLASQRCPWKHPDVKRVIRDVQRGYFLSFSPTVHQGHLAETNVLWWCTVRMQCLPFSLRSPCGFGGSETSVSHYADYCAWQWRRERARQQPRK